MTTIAECLQKAKIYHEKADRLCDGLEEVPLNMLRRINDEGEPCIPFELAAIAGLRDAARRAEVFAEALTRSKQ